MTLRFTDGFDSYAATADLLKKWQSNAGATWNATAGRNGGGAIQWSSNTVLKSYPLPLSGNNANGTLWFKSTAKPASSLGILVYIDSSSSNLGYFIVTSNGFLQLTAGGTNAILATGSLNICDGNWHFIEYQMNLAGSAQTQICWVDSVQQYNLSVRVNAGGSNAASMLELAGLTSATVTIDDVCIFDNSGSSPVNADQPIGPQQINTLRPNGDSAIQFSPDTGSTNYTQINEVNGDTAHYVQDGTSGDQDLYNYDDLGFSPSRIWGVMANAYCNTPGVGSINHNQLCKSNATTTTGTTTQTPITNPRVIQEPFVLDPNTSGAWGSSGLNSALFGIKVS